MNPPASPFAPGLRPTPTAPIAGKASQAGLAAPDGGQLATLRRAAHPLCVVCGRDHAHGLRLEFELRPDGSVEAGFAATETFEGYHGRLHGGIIAALLDGAMTNCLFAHGRCAFTAELTVRYHQPVTTTDQLTVRAWLTGTRTRLYHVQAELRVDGDLKASASAKFMDAPQEGPAGEHDSGPAGRLPQAPPRGIEPGAT